MAPKFDVHDARNEPHLRPLPPSGTAGQTGKPAPQTVGRHDVTLRIPTMDEMMDHNVWDEPHMKLAQPRRGPSMGTLPDGARCGRCNYDLRGQPADGHCPECGLSFQPEPMTFGQWMRAKRAATTAAESWSAVLWVVLLAGPMAVLTALISGGSSVPFLAAILWAPVTEETAKILLPFWVLERKPHVFRSATQLVLCGVASGLAFAVIENLIYLNIYIPQPTEALVAYRWTVCVVLHGGCSLIASLGLVHVYQRMLVDGKRASLTAGLPFLIVAMVVHGFYNAMVSLLELSETVRF